MKVFVYLDAAFKETSIDLFVEHLLSLKIKYLSSKQDCYDWIVYANYLIVDDDCKTVSYGVEYTVDDEIFYYTEKDNAKITKWYDDVLIQ